MNYVVDDIGAVVALMRTDKTLINALTVGLPALDDLGYRDWMPEYMFGHRVEIAAQLSLKDADNVFKYKKYPLVALKLDTSEQNDQGLINYTLNVALLMSTDRNWTAQERYTNVFKPVLYPMYESFLKQIKASGLFFWPAKDKLKRPKHTKIDRPYWGTPASEGNTANYFNDPLDAIELLDLKLTQTIKC